MSRSNTGPSPAIRQRVIDRDSPHGWKTCQWCGRTITDAYSLQHRRARAGGGSVEKATNLPSNLVLMCGTATTGCHGYVESHPFEASARGFRVRQGDDPAHVQIKTYSHGVCLLDDFGGITRQEVDF